MITIAYLFFWEEDNDKKYFTNFLKYYFGDVNVVDYNDNPDILFVSLLGGDIETMKTVNAKIKIFFTGENPTYNISHYPFNNDEEMNKIFDINCGFKYSNTRFPLWLMYYPYYDYKEDEDNIIKYIQSAYDINVKKEKPFLSTLLSHNDSHSNNYRQVLYEIFSNYDDVICASSLFNNYPTIGPTNEDKINHISKSTFNICPENSYGEGYFTEKIFQALESGTIPVYWSSDYPEENIINKNKYIFCNFNDINAINSINATINDVVNNNDKKLTYIEGPIFKDDAGTHIKTFYDNLKNKIKEQLDIKNIPYDLTR
jgi:glycosyltransferase involved in cell wall biosynthesis